MARRPSKLWRVLGATEPVFRVVTTAVDGGELTDHDLTGISIEAGSTMQGLSTAGATLDLSSGAALRDTPSGTYVAAIELTPAGADLIGSLTGVFPSTISARLYGRIAGTEVTDRGDGKPRPARVMVSDWSSYLTQTNLGGSSVQAGGPTTLDLIRDLYARTFPAQTLAAWGADWHHVAPDDQFKHHDTSTILGTYCSELGYLVRTTREGTPTINSLDNLTDNVAAWDDFHPDVLHRSQVLEPVTWARTANIPKTFEWDETTTAGTTSHHYVGLPTGVGGVQPVAETKDTSHVRVVGPGLTPVMLAAVARENRTRLAVQSVTVDLLGLIRRNWGSDRRQVGQILKMLHGDPIALGYDWPDQVRRIYFAKTISHKITASEWTVTLDLEPEDAVTGTLTRTNFNDVTWDNSQYARAGWDADPNPVPWDFLPATN